MANNFGTLDAAWQTYREEVIPDGASPTQVRECRRAFYAGAMTVMQCVKFIGTDAVPEQAGVEMLDGMDGELKRFLEGVKRSAV